MLRDRPDAEDRTCGSSAERWFTAFECAEYPWAVHVSIVLSYVNFTSVFKNSFCRSFPDVAFTYAEIILVSFDLTIDRPLGPCWDLTLVKRLETVTVESGGK